MMKDSSEPSTGSFVRFPERVFCEHVLIASVHTALRLLVDRSAAEGVDELRVIKEAHEILTDPVQKAEYDSHRLQKNAPSPAKQPHLVSCKLGVQKSNRGKH